MAKGIRSKAKRHNRSQLRATLSQPQINKRQEQLAAALKKDLEEKNGSTIKGLTGLFPGSGGLSSISSIAAQQATMEVEDEDNRAALKKKVSKAEKPKVVKGSKARINLKKELTWF